MGGDEAYEAVRKKIAATREKQLAAAIRERDELRAVINSGVKAWLHKGSARATTSRSEARRWALSSLRVVEGTFIEARAAQQDGES